MHALNARERIALEKLRYECDYEDSRVGGAVTYVLKNALCPGVGEKTLLDLQAFGLIEAGTNRWFNVVGYRITDLGRKTLLLPSPSKLSKPSLLKILPHRLKTLSPRLKK